MLEMASMVLPIHLSLPPLMNARYYVLIHRFHLHTMNEHDDLLPLIKLVEQSNRQVK